MISLIKINRLTAWFLLFCIVLLFVSGYGMTKSIISPSTASKMHLGLVNIITLFVFTIHSAISIHFALRRWGRWNIFTKILLSIFFTTFFGFFVYVDRFYAPAVKTAESSKTTTSATNTSSTVSQSTNTTTIEKTFTASNLSQYNGQNGQPAYVAVDGVVYDLSAVFRDGIHYGFDAGQDQSSAFHSKHYDSILSGYTIVGKLVQ